MTIREILFRDWPGCTSHGCIVTGPKQGQGTNGPCHCITGANRAQLHILHSRLTAMMTAAKNILEEQERDYE